MGEGRNQVVMQKILTDECGQITLILPALQDLSESSSQPSHWGNGTAPTLIQLSSPMKLISGHRDAVTHRS